MLLIKQSDVIAIKEIKYRLSFFKCLKIDNIWVSKLENILPSSTFAKIIIYKDI
jgi:hypothetical protein